MGQLIFGRSALEGQKMILKKKNSGLKTTVPPSRDEESDGKMENSFLQNLNFFLEKE